MAADERRPCSIYEQHNAGRKSLSGMPTWGQILDELNRTLTPQGIPDFDRVRRKYLASLAQHTGRSTIIYASEFLMGAHNPEAIMISLSDMQALMEMVKDLPGPDLDLILHTPGGNPEALESLVRYLRTRFKHIRAFVPLAAMSAGTMWALACDEIVMGKHSQLGPIDPQFTLAFGEQLRSVPAQAIVDQFEKAVDVCQHDMDRMPAWITVLRSYGPSLLQECESAQQLSTALVVSWLTEHMFSDRPNAAELAAAVAKFFADYRTHYSHSRPISREQTRDVGVKITDLEADQQLQDAVLSVFHATMHTLSGTGTAKLVENNLGRTFAVTLSQVRITAVPGSPADVGGRGSPITGSSRQQRRQSERNQRKGRR